MIQLELSYKTTTKGQSKHPEKTDCWILNLVKDYEDQKKNQFNIKRKVRNLKKNLYCRMNSNKAKY